MDNDKIIEVDNLTINFRSQHENTLAVDDISFSLSKSEILGIVGESGSGKSVTALSLLKLLPSSAQVKAGKIMFHSKTWGSQELNKIDNKSFTKFRGQELSMVFQEPMTSLNPVFTCGDQVSEMLRVHENLKRSAAKARTIELFNDVQLPRPEHLFETYPHEISGGQKQRVMIAMAMACKPSVLIADEPTTALDVTVQKSILELMMELRKTYGTSIIFITHDLGVIAEITDRILVMYKGKIVEEGSVWNIFSNPQHPYTKGLLACRPRTDLRLNHLPTIEDFMEVDEKGELVERQGKYKSVGEAIIHNIERKDQLIEKRFKTANQRPLLKIKNLKKYYPIRKGIFGKIEGVVKAVDNVSFEIFPGETIGLVGESGCGKTTLGRLILKLIEPTDGLVIYKGQVINYLSEKYLRGIRKKLQIIFQDPYSSLNPRKTIGQAILEPLVIHNILNDHKQQREKVFELLETVNLKPEYYYRFPHEFSGGQRQRICIARALALQPEFIICDESVSALDVSVQAQILNLLNRLKAEYNFTYIFISHDLSVVKFMADRIFVMKDGQLIEMGYPDTLYERPKTDYTRNLIEAIPKSDLEDIRKAQIKRKLAGRN